MDTQEQQDSKKQKTQKSPPPGVNVKKAQEAKKTKGKYFNKITHNLPMQYVAMFPQLGFGQFAQRNLDSYVYKNHFLRAKDYKSMDSIIEAFPHLSDINNRNPLKDITNIEKARCFILRSNCDDNIHKSIKYEIWTSTNRTNQMLNQAFSECQEQQIPLLLMFSVFNTNQILAVGQMVSFVEEDDFNYWWDSNKWRNKFKVTWHYVKDVPYKKFYHLKFDDGRSVVRCRDGQEIPWEIAKEMLKIFKEADKEINLFEAFKFLDVREDVLRTTRSPSPGNMFNPYMMMMSQMYGGGMQNMSQMMMNMGAMGQMGGMGGGNMGMPGMNMGGRNYQNQGKRMPMPQQMGQMGQKQMPMMGQKQMPMGMNQKQMPMQMNQKQMPMQMNQNKMPMQMPQQQPFQQNQMLSYQIQQGLQRPNQFQQQGGHQSNNVLQNQQRQQQLMKKGN